MNAVVNNIDANESTNANSFGLEQNNYVDILVENYNKQKENLISAHENFNQISGLNNIILGHYGVKMPEFEKTFHLLNVHFWGEVYKRSNIETFLDAEKRKKWSNDLFVDKDNKAELPEFNRQNVLSTLKSWYEARTEFFIERVDLVFKNLSQSHITNEPQGFSKKMIFSCGCRKNYMNDYMTVNDHKQEILYDLACAIAVILNRPNPPHSIKESFKNLNTGEKISFFGNSFELQVFKNGSLHVWVSPEIAIELNLWLAKKYPMAIASEFRTKKTTFKEFSYSHDYLMVEDYALLSSLCRGGSVFSFLYGREKDVLDARKKAIDRFEKFTGIDLKNNDQNIRDLAKRILGNGYPNVKDHQFYPTPDAVQSSIKNHLNENYSEETLSELKMLEPSAGIGNLAKIHPNYENQVDCIEVNKIFADVLRVKGFANVSNEDFMKFKTDKEYDLIVMNPPYKEKQLEKHLEKALSHLKTDGELIAVIPLGKVSTIAKMKGFENLHIVSKHDSEFEDTKIQTAVISLIK